MVGWPACFVASYSVACQLPAWQCYHWSPVVALAKHLAGVVALALLGANKPGNCLKAPLQEHPWHMHPRLLNQPVTHRIKHCCWCSMVKALAIATLAVSITDCPVSWQASTDSYCVPVCIAMLELAHNSRP